MHIKNATQKNHVQLPHFFIHFFVHKKMNTPGTTLLLLTYDGVGRYATGQTIYEWENVDLIEIPASESAESYHNARNNVVLQFTLARVATARVWNAARALMSSLGDMYVAPLNIDPNDPFYDAANVSALSHRTSYRCLTLSADNHGSFVGAPRDPNTLAQRDT